MKKKKDILLVSPFFFPTNTYQQELCTRLVKAYSDLNISVLCYKTSSKVSPRFRNLKIYSVPCFTLIKDRFVIPNYIALIRELRTIKKSKDIKLVMCETRFFESSWWVTALSRAWNIPSVLIDHCASVPKHEFFIIQLFLNLFDELFAPVILNLYSAVFCSNKAVQGYLKSLGVNNTKFIGAGVDSDFFNPSKRSKASNLSIIGANIKVDDILITFASRLISTKGVELFFKSVSSSKVLENPKLKVVIAGQGPLYKKLKQKIISQNLKSKVFLTGLLSRENLSFLLARTDIFVHPSMHHDGIPNVILEAGASSCFVIATPSGGTEEVIKDSKTGVIVKDLSFKNLEQAIEEGILNKEKRLTFGKALRSLVMQDYRWEDVALRSKALITRLISRL